MQEEVVRTIDEDGDGDEEEHEKKVKVVTHSIVVSFKIIGINTFNIFVIDLD